MKKNVIIMLLLSSCFAFGQSKQENLIDSILVVNTGKTYKEYFAYFEKVEKGKKTQKNETKKIYNEIGSKNGTIPTIPITMYHNKEYPLVSFVYKNHENIMLKDISKIKFDKIKNIFFIPIHYEINKKQNTIVIEVE